MENYIRVMIADGHTLVREGITQLLQKENDLEVVGETESGQDMLKAMENIHADVLLLDLVMPEMDRYRIFPLLREKTPSTKVLILADHFDQQLIIPALRQGARGYILKTVPSTELCEAIRMVHAGEVWIEQSVVGYLLEYFLDSAQEDHFKPKRKASPLLSEREEEVARLVAEGCSNKEIADRLSISEKTVKAHLVNIFKKLQIHHRLELALYTRQWLCC